MILDQMHDRMNTTMHRTAVRALCIAEIHTSRPLTVTGNMYRMRNKLIDTFILCCGNRHNRNAKCILQQVDIDRAAVVADLIHHIECKNHRDIQFDQLQCEIQIPLNIRGIHNIDNSTRTIL